MATRKINSTTELDAKGLGVTLQSGSENDYPLAYVRSLWDVATNSQKQYLVSLLGAEGQYSQEEINKAIANKLHEIGENIATVASAGAYVAPSSGTFFLDSEALPASANQNDYALVLESDTATTTVGRYHWDTNQWVRDYSLDSGQFTAGQWELIEAGRVDAALMQKLGDLDTAAALNTVISGLGGRLDTIEGLIPSQATAQNQLADKAFVNSSIASNTATFRGVYESVASLPASQSGLKNGDYAYVHNLAASESGNPSYLRYKYSDATTRSFAIGDDTYERNIQSDIMGGSGHDTPMYAWKHGSTIIYTFSGVLVEGSYAFYDDEGQPTDQTINTGSIVSGNGWLYEYTLNNSSFTAAQWAALNSGITAPQQQYVAGLMQKDLQDKANAKLVATTTVLSGGTYYTDEEASHDMVVKVVLTYDGTAKDATNLSALTSAGWVKTQDKTGEYTKTVQSTGSAVSVAAQTFEYEVQTGTYAGITAETKSISKSLTVIKPFYYGFYNETVSSASDVANMVSHLTRYNSGNTAKLPDITSVPGTGTQYYYVVVAPGRSATAVQPAAGDLFVNPSTGNTNVSTYSFTSPQVDGPTLSNYKVYRTVNPLTGGSAIADLTVTIS